MSALCCNKPLLTYEGDIDVSQVMGAWYVIGVLPTPFEKDAFNPVEKYTWNEKKKWVDVDFTFNQGSLTGPIKSVPQALTVPNYPISKGGSWKAKPYKLPILALDYIVMDIAEDYTSIVVGHPSRKWLWIMAKDKPELDENVFNKALELAKGEGFDVEQIVRPEHTPQP
mmetsp:Transcript_11326/g.12978  ORF Transcript_11326/g.12978 Transcript_11326/m.12978 type:complete len:169 (-) Transcript_11326:2000-2506(-)